MIDRTGPKRAGKTEWSGRRRPSTRGSGFHTDANATGGHFRRVVVPKLVSDQPNSITITFNIDEIGNDSWVGFGGWIYLPENSELSYGEFSGRPIKSDATAPDWRKFGSMWEASAGESFSIDVTIDYSGETELAVYELDCGVIEHAHLSDARPELLKNMYQFSPEAHFYSVQGHVKIRDQNDVTIDPSGQQEIYLKSCNRCARFLPINIDDEQAVLSFTNHCKADHRVPCSHTNFGKLVSEDSNKELDLYNGFQLECRFCKKFEVNAALNPQRSSAQMKEDGQRRRYFESLISEMNERSESLVYRHEHGVELSDEIFDRFGGECFKCKKKFTKRSEMNMDHTRPLALLWPLDETATALCKNCNSSKRDRFPNDFYSDDELKKLSDLTGIDLAELKSPSANMTVVNQLKKNIEWLIEDFLQSDDLRKVRDGKRTNELVAKALDKALGMVPVGAPFNVSDLLSDWSE